MTADESAARPKRTLESVVANFVAGLEARLNSIDTAFAARDWDELRMLSHKLAGAALFGYPDLGEAAHVLEKAVKIGNIEQISDLISAVKHEYVQIVNKTSL